MLSIRSLFGGRPAAPDNMTGKTIMDRYKDAAEIKHPWISHFEECYRYAIPHRNTFYETSKGQKRNVDVFDSTAVLGVPSFATKMQSLLMPPWREWSQVTLGPDVPKMMQKNKRIKERLAEQNDVMFSHVNHSNIALQVHESFQDLAIGTGSFDILAGPFGRPILNFNAVPLTELTLEEGPQSTIDTTYRDLKVKARNLDRQWVGAEPSPKLQKLVQDEPNRDLHFLEAVIYDPERQRWNGSAVWKDEKEVIWRAPFRTNPRIVFRWSVTPGEIYGRGPIMHVLPDIKTANKVVEFILRNAALAVSGMWTATADSALNPYNFRITPGGVVPVASNDQRNPTIKALERSGDIQLGFEVLMQLQDVIKRSLFQMLREPSDAVISATQFAIEHRELVDTAGSSFGRLQTEVVEASASRIIDVLSERGAMADIRLDGRMLKLKHLSPLARAQDMDDLLTLQQTQESVPDESFALGIKVEELGQWVAEKTGLDPRLIRSEGEREQLQQQAAQLIAQSQQAA